MNPSWNVDWCVSQETDNKGMLCSSKNNAILSNGHDTATTNNKEEEKKNWRANMKASLMKATNLSRSGSVKILIHKFSASDSSGQITPNVSPSQQGKDGTGSEKDSEIPAVTVTPPSGESKNIFSGPSTHSHSEGVSVCKCVDDLCSRCIARTALFRTMSLMHDLHTRHHCHLGVNAFALLVTTLLTFLGHKCLFSIKCSLFITPIVLISLYVFHCMGTYMSMKYSYISLRTESFYSDGSLITKWVLELICLFESLYTLSKIQQWFFHSFIYTCFDCLLLELVCFFSACTSLYVFCSMCSWRHKHTHKY